MTGSGIRGRTSSGIAGSAIPSEGDGVAKPVSSKLDRATLVGRTRANQIAQSRVCHMKGETGREGERAGGYSFLTGLLVFGTSLF